MSRPLDLVQRILDYADKTKIEFFLTPRLSDWADFGLPDLRGFCPHLRRVNLYKNQSHLKTKSFLRALIAKELRTGKPGQGLWLLHDILHIAFYDYATLNMGKTSWGTHERFLENHLASEFFSVLLLDYHFLIYTKTKGLAVSLDHEDWPDFMKKNPLLPPLGGIQFAKVLFDMYFEGQPIIINDKSSKKLDQWIGHEMRYAKKQRYYVVQWWEDLQGLKPSHKEAQIFGSQAIFPVWELLGIFLSPGKKEWSNYLSRIEPVKNNFSNFKKYKKSTQAFDFRFTDIAGLKKEKLLEMVMGIEKPCASGLFLMYQILSTFKPARFDKRTLSQFSELAKEANAEGPSQELWTNTKKIIQSAVRGPHFPAQKHHPLTVGTFFLP